MISLEEIQKLSKAGTLEDFTASSVWKKATDESSISQMSVLECKEFVFSIVRILKKIRDQNFSKLADELIPPILVNNGDEIKSSLQSQKTNAIKRARLEKIFGKHAEVLAESMFLIGKRLKDLVAFERKDELLNDDFAKLLQDVSGFESYVDKALRAMGDDDEEEGKETLVRSALLTSSRRAVPAKGERQTVASSTDSEEDKDGVKKSPMLFGSKRGSKLVKRAERDDVPAKEEKDETDSDSLLSSSRRSSHGGSMLLSSSRRSARGSSTEAEEEGKKESVEEPFSEWKNKSRRSQRTSEVVTHDSPEDEKIVLIKKRKRGANPVPPKPSHVLRVAESVIAGEKCYVMLSDALKNGGVVDANIAKKLSLCLKKKAEYKQCIRFIFQTAAELDSGSRPTGEFYRQEDITSITWMIYRNDDPQAIILVYDSSK